MIIISETFVETITIKNPKNPEANLGTSYVNEKFLLRVVCYIPYERSSEGFLMTIFSKTLADTVTIKNPKKPETNLTWYMSKKNIL